MTEIKRRLGPWMTGGFIVMVITGALLFYAIPVRSYQNIFFRIKVVMLILAGMCLGFFVLGILMLNLIHQQNNRDQQQAQGLAMFGPGVQKRVRLRAGAPRRPASGRAAAPDPCSASR